jgi:hypothetical protein
MGDQTQEMNIQQNASACSILLGILSAVSFIFTFMGFVAIILAFLYWRIKPEKIPY